MDIFESVQIILDNNIYNITVKEKTIISYAPLIRKEDGIGWSIGPMVNINNINGKAKNIYFSSSIGAIKSGDIKYFNQKILLEYKYNQFKSIESDYTINNGFIIPKNLTVDVRATENFLAEFNYTKITTNKAIKMRFSIPKSYVKID